MDLVGMGVQENMRKLKMTILHRPGGIWHDSEVLKLANGLMTQSRAHPNYPEYVILYGHYTKEETLKAIGDGLAYTATQVVGMDNKELPFRPSFY